LSLGNRSKTFTNMAALPFATAGFLTVIACEPSAADAVADKSKLTLVSVVRKLLTDNPEFTGTETCAPSKLAPPITKLFVSLRLILSGVTLLTMIVGLRGITLRPA